MCAHLRLAAGRCPAAAGEVVVSARDARSLGLRPGDHLTLRDGSGSQGRVRATVVGSYPAVRRCLSLLGAGKSTLLNLFAGLLRPSAGRLHVGEHEIARMDERGLARMRAADVGVVLQGAMRNLLPYPSPLDNVRFAQRGARKLRDDLLLLPAAREVLGLVGLAQHAATPLAALSPGQRQRLAVGVGMAARPGLLLLDEPTTQLDHAGRDEVLQAVADVNRDLGTTVVAVTHDPDVADRLPRTVTIRDGRVGAEGRRGEDFAVVARDGSLTLRLDVLDSVPPGSLLRVTVDDDGAVQLQRTDDGLVGRPGGEETP